MAKLILLLSVLFAAQAASAQSAFKVVIKDEATKEPIAGATVTVKDREISAVTDAQGVAQLANVPAGEQVMNPYNLWSSQTAGKCCDTHIDKRLVAFSEV